MARGAKAVKESRQLYKVRPVSTRGRMRTEQVRRAQPAEWMVVERVGVDGKPHTIRVRNREHLKILRRDDALYEKYARHLEATHKGEFVAIGLNGELIVREDMDEAGLAAIERFGRRNFAFRRIGYDAEIVICDCAVERPRVHS